MKKALITLFAFVGAAGAAQTTIDFSFATSSDVIEFNSITLAQDWTLTLNLQTNVTSAFNQWGTPILSTNSINGDYQLLQVYATANGEKIVVKSNNDKDTYRIEKTQQGTTGQADWDAWKATSAKTFVMDYKIETKTLTFNVTGANETAIASNSWSGIDFGDNVLTQFTTNISATQVASQGWTLPSGSFTYGKADPVPEPTTATLSLLALCGLAARRRRK